MRDALPLDALADLFRHVWRKWGAFDLFTGHFVVAGPVMQQVAP